MVPSYNPRDIVANLKRLIADEEMEAMIPWYRGFCGEITPDPKSDQKFNVRGVITKVDDTTLEITEQPINSWTNAYTDFLVRVATTDSFPQIVGALLPCMWGFSEIGLTDTLALACDSDALTSQLPSSHSNPRYIPCAPALRIARGMYSFSPHGASIVDEAFSLSKSIVDMPKVVFEKRSTSSGWSAVMEMFRPRTVGLALPGR